MSISIGPAPLSPSPISLRGVAFLVYVLGINFTELPGVLHILSLVSGVERNWSKVKRTQPLAPIFGARSSIDDNRISRNGITKPNYVD
jgi:hypothetical protein